MQATLLPLYLQLNQQIFFLAISGSCIPVLVLEWIADLFCPLGGRHQHDCCATANLHDLGSVSAGRSLQLADFHSRLSYMTAPQMQQLQSELDARTYHKPKVSPLVCQPRGIFLVCATRDLFSIVIARQSKKTWFCKQIGSGLSPLKNSVVSSRTKFRS